VAELAAEIVNAVLVPLRNVVEHHTLFSERLRANFALERFVDVLEVATHRRRRRERDAADETSEGRHHVVDGLQVGLHLAFVLECLVALQTVEGGRKWPGADFRFRFNVVVNEHVVQLELITCRQCYKTFFFVVSEARPSTLGFVFRKPLKPSLYLQVGWNQPE
jgi:hypothetical protein